MNVRHILGISGGKDSAALAICGEKYEIVLKGKLNHFGETIVPRRFQLGINVNEAAGQSMFHVHIHLISRNKGGVENPKGGVMGVIPRRQPYRKNNCKTTESNYLKQ